MTGSFNAFQENPDLNTIEFPTQNWYLFTEVSNFSSVQVLQSLFVKFISI